MSPATVQVAVASALAIAELDRLKALEILPTPETLLERMRAREADFNVLVGVCLAYLGSDPLRMNQCAHGTKPAPALDAHQAPAHFSTLGPHGVRK